MFTKIQSILFCHKKHFKVYIIYKRKIYALFVNNKDNNVFYVMVIGIFLTNLLPIFLSINFSVLLFDSSLDYLIELFSLFFYCFCTSFNQNSSVFLTYDGESHIVLKYNNGNMTFLRLLLANQVTYVFHSNDKEDYINFPFFFIFRFLNKTSESLEKLRVSIKIFAQKNKILLLDDFTAVVDRNKFIYIIYFSLLRNLKEEWQLMKI